MFSASKNSFSNRPPVLRTRKKKNPKTQHPAVKIPKGKKIFHDDGFLGGADESEASDEEFERSAVDSSSDSDDFDSFINMDDFPPDRDTIPWELEPTEFKANAMVPEQNETPKVNLQLGPDSDPIDFFLLIFDKKIIIDAVAATNQYHRAKPSHKQGLIPHGKVWKDIQDYEMARFLGLLYLMGILKKSVLRDYWSIDPLVETPSFRFTMTRDRFSDIANHFRLYEKSRMDRKDPLYKIRHFINQIIENSRKHYTPSRNLSLDESMISYKGRNRFKMYMPNKPTRFGFKAYVVADACSGFALSWEMHSFTKNNPFSLRDTIIRLLAPYRNSGFFVYMDRFYTSPEIVAELAQQGINVCGTVLSARLCLPDSVREDINTLNHLEYKHFKAENQRFAVLRDGSKFVYLLSSFHGNFAVESMRTLRKRERKKDPTAAMLGVTKRKVVIPQMIVDYNKYMGGVDRLDQCISTYCYAPRTLKWQMRVFYYFLDIAMFNSYVIYKKKQQEAKRKSFLTHKEFRIEVIRSLIGINKLTSAKRIKLLMKAEAGELSKEFGCTLVSIEKPRECQICSGARNEYNKKIRTQFMCKTCQMPVCIRGCYDKHYREAELGKTNN